MARKPRPPGKKYNYMDTYGDLVTLLLCFFVLLFSMGTIEKSKFNSFAEVLGQQFGKVVVVDTPVVNYTPKIIDSNDSDTAGAESESVQVEHMNEMAEKLEQHIIENNLQGNVELHRSESGVVFIRLSNNLLFDGDSFELQQRSLHFLDYLGELFVTTKQDIYTINCVGHTAEAAESVADDWILSGERAGIVASYFDNMVGFPPTKLSVTAYGRMFPIADNSDPVAKVANRRVDIIVIGNDPDKLAQSLIEASLVYFPDDDTQYFQGKPEDLPGHQLGLISGYASLAINPER